MTTLNEPRATAEFLISEANGYRSREEGNVVGGAAPGLVAGTVLGQLANGNYARHTVGASDGSQTIKGILFETAVGTVSRTVIVRDAEVVGAHLNYSAGADAAAKATANAALRALGIIVR
jgi:hypothetical protein